MHPSRGVPSHNSRDLAGDLAVRTPELGMPSVRPPVPVNLDQRAHFDWRAQTIVHSEKVLRQSYPKEVIRDRLLVAELRRELRRIIARLGEEPTESRTVP